MASISANGSKGHHKFTLNVTETSTSVENNTSAISWNFVLSPIQKSWDWSYSSTVPVTYSITINGTTYTGNIMNYDGSSTVTVRSGSMTVTHNADGAKSISFSFSVSSLDKSYLPGSASSSGSMALTFIARASQPSCITHPNTTQNVGDLGSTITIYTNRKNTNFTHYVYAIWGNTTVEIGTGIRDSVSWKLPLEFANQVPNGTSGVGKIYVSTYNGKTNIGTKSVGFTATIPASMIPSVTIATSDPTGYKNKYGAFVQGQSKFQTDVTASGVYGSTIKSYKVTANGKTYTSVPVTTDAISGSGELTIKATVTDSRNRASAVSGKVNVLPYVSPKINSISVYRCNEEGKKVNSGEYLAVVFSAEITALNNVNSAAYSIQYKKSNDTNYITEVITDYSGQYTVQNGVFIFVADTSSSYDIILTASDDFLSVERAATGSSIKKLWSILKKKFGFAFGKIAELENTIEFAINALFYNKANFLEGLQINGTDLDYIVEQGEQDGWFYRKWNSGVAECWQVYYGTGINAAETNYNGFYYSKVLTVNFPFKFANLPTVTVDGGSNAHMNFVRVYGKYDYCASFMVVGLANVTNTDVTVDIKAIGRWK